MVSAVSMAQLALVALPLVGFVLNGADTTATSALPGPAYRWSVPESSGSGEGLGGGINYVIDPHFCTKMLSRFAERDIFYGLELKWAQFVHCNDIQDAIRRGFATWSANHRLISFADVGTTAPCTSDGGATGALTDACPWELYVGTDDGSQYRNLAAYVLNHRTSAVQPNGWWDQPVRSSAGVVEYGVDAHARSVMRFQTHLCWYLDATFCYYFQKWDEERDVDVKLIVRAILIAVFGLAAMRLAGILFWCLVALLCLGGAESSRLRKRGCCSRACSAFLDYLSSLSPFGNVLVIFFIIFPPVFYDRIFMPCWECFDFEAAVAHETGHVLGFGHPDAAPERNLVGACEVTNSTCRSPFDCAAQTDYTEAEQSIMHSLTQHTPRTCLSMEDMRGLYFLYPLCDTMQPTAVSCVKGRRLSGWLRLGIVVGVPFLLAVLVILVPLTCLRWRDRRRQRELLRELGRADTEILEYRSALNEALRATVRGAISRPVSALHNNRNRPGTALNRISRAVSSNRIHPVDESGVRPREHGGRRGGERRGGERRGGERRGSNRRLEDVQEAEGGSTTSIDRPTNTVSSRRAVPGQAKQSAALNGYTGVAWPADASPDPEPLRRNGDGQRRERARRWSDGQS